MVAPHPPSADRPDHIPALDGLRAIAVLLVLWTHTPLHLQAAPLRDAAQFLLPGYLGVDVFFVLSGFLITRILLSEKDRGVPLWKFMVRRAVRIFPAYYLLLLVVAAVAWGPDVPWCAVYLGNVYYPLHGTGGPLQHTWSLCVEEHFYLLWPPILALLPGRSSVWVALSMVPIGVAAAVWWGVEYSPARLMADREAWTAEYVQRPEDAMEFARRWIQAGSVFRFVSLALGCLLAFGERRVRRARWGIPIAVLCLAFGALGSETVWVHAAQEGWVDPGALVQWLDWFPAMRLWAYAMLSTALLVMSLVASSSRFAAPLRWAPLRAIGRISYGLYLYHLPIFRLAFSEREHPAWIGLAWGLAFLAAAVSYRYFEAPLLRRVRGLR